MRLQVTDDEGAKSVADHTVTIANRAPTAAVGGPAEGFRGQSLTFTATGDDPDPGADALTFAWDSDDDGQFDDGAGASKAVQFGSRVQDGARAGDRRRRR